MTTSVPCPSPVKASEPYNTATKESADGFSVKNIRQARSGPIVCEEEGPFPMRYNSFNDFIFSSPMAFNAYLVRSFCVFKAFFFTYLL